MLPEDGDRITFRLTDEQKKDIQDGLKKNLLEGVGNYPIPSDRPMLVHRGFWKQSKEGENSETGENNAEAAEGQGGEADGFQFFGAQIPHLGPPTPPPLPPPPPPLSARGGALGLQRWGRASPLSSTTTPAAAAAVGSGGAAQVSNIPGQQGLPLSTAGVDTSALNRQQAAEFFNSRVGREANGSLWRTVGNHQRRPSQPDATRQLSLDASIPPVLRRIRNRSNRGRRHSQPQQPYQSNMALPPPPPALQRQETSTNLFQRRRSLSGNANNALVPSGNNAPSTSTNNDDETDDGRPVFGLSNTEHTEYNFFFSSTVPLTSAFDDADDEATSSTSANGRRSRRSRPTDDEPLTPPTAGTQHVALPARHTTASLLDWATSVISTATAPRNTSGFFSNTITAAAPFAGYGQTRAGEAQAPTGGLLTNRSPARRRLSVSATSPVLPHRDEDSSAAEYLGMDISDSLARLSRRSSPLFEPISRGSRGNRNSEQEHN